MLNSRKKILIFKYKNLTPISHPLLILSTLSTSIKPIQKIRTFAQLNTVLIFVDKLDETAFLEDLVDAFPAIKEQVYSEDNISIQVGCLRIYCQKAINDNNIAAALKSFRFVDRMLDKVNFSIENALVISLIGSLKFDKNPDLYNSVPDRLKEYKVTLAEHYKSFSAPKKIKNKVKKTSKPSRKIRH